MKKILTCLLLMTYLFSCKKDESPADAFFVLTNHTWYPYEVLIQSTDTLIATVTDNSGQHTTSQNSRFDTSFLMEPCLQNSRVQFLKSGVLNISNSCSLPNINTDTAWSLSQNRLLTFVSINSPALDKYFYQLSQPFGGAFFQEDSLYDLHSSGGLITLINQSKFIIDGGDRILKSSISRNNGAGVFIDTITKITSKTFITYKSAD